MRLDRFFRAGYDAQRFCGNMPRMSRGRTTVLEALRTNLPKKANLLLAVSGGADSMALLHGCAELQRIMGWKLRVAHLNHGLRKEAKEDLQLVRMNAKLLGIPFSSKSLKRPGPKVNIEEWGRRSRYSFFLELVRRYKLDAVATAHTANDVAETLLMRLVSNKELGGIMARDPQRMLLRPLLSVSRGEIDRYLGQRGIEFATDATNLDTSYLRNRVRHVLIPLLKKEFDGRIEEVLSQRAAGLAEDRELLDREAGKSLARLAALRMGSKEWLRAFRRELEALDPCLQWRLAQLVMKDKLGYNLGRIKAAALSRFVTGSAAALELPGPVRLRKSGGGLTISRPKRAGPSKVH